MTENQPQEKVSLAFSGHAPESLPDALENATVEYLGPSTYRITSAPHEWIVDASAVHLHREIAARFYAAVPPRTPPWPRRLFFRLVLALIARPWGKRLLLKLRGR
jgi:hypothetical protein